MWTVDLAQRPYLQKKDPQNGRHFKTEGKLKNPYVYVAPFEPSKLIPNFLTVDKGVWL